MKKINIFLLIAIGTFLVTLSSCSTSQTFMVQGVPGTVISSPTNQRLAVLDNMGQAQIKTKRKEGYYHYLQAQTPGSNLQVPFALDYDNHSRGTGRGLIETGKVFFYTISLCGSIGALSAMAFDSADSPVVGIGLAAGLGGALFGLGFEAANSGEPIDNDYNYLKKQATNSDILR